MSRQQIIKQTKLVTTNTPHFCAKCGLIIPEGTRARTVTTYNQDQFGKSYQTKHYCRTHKIKTYCGKKVLY